MTRSPQLLLAVAGLGLAAIGGAILWANPPLPPAFGGSFHGNVQELSILADRIGAVALVMGLVLLLFSLFRAARPR